MALLGGAVNIEAFEELLMFDPREVKEQEGIAIRMTKAPGRNNLRSVTVYIEMPEYVVYVLHYFTWEGGRPVWQDAVQITPEAQARNWEIVSSGLFYQEGETEYTADFPRLSCGLKRQTGWFQFGPSENVLITGALSYPFGSENQGGYVLYRFRLVEEEDRYITYSIFSYAHLNGPLRIPYAKTEDRMLSGAFTWNNLRQQQYTTYESLALKK